MGVHKSVKLFRCAIEIESVKIDIAKDFLTNWISTLAGLKEEHYSVFQRLAIFAHGGQILSSSQFSIIPRCLKK
jgi:hypothetical protein